MIRRTIQLACHPLFRSLPLLNVHNHSGLAGFGSNGSGPEQGRVPHRLQPNGEGPLVHLHRGTDPPDCPTLAVVDETLSLLGASASQTLPTSEEKALRTIPCSAPFFHSSLLAITILAQIVDGCHITTLDTTRWDPRRQATLRLATGMTTTP